MPNKKYLRVKKQLRCFTEAVFSLNVDIIMGSAFTFSYKVKDLINFYHLH